MSGNNKIVWVRNADRYGDNSERAEVQLSDGRRLPAATALKHKDPLVQGMGFKAVRLNRRRYAEGN